MNDTGKIILIVDDEADVRIIMRSKLESVGYKVIEAENGKEAVDTVKAEHPDLIIMDVKMPIMNGVEAVTALMNDQETKDAKIIFLTNYGEGDAENEWIDEKYAKEIGALGHVRKTDDLSVILERIKTILGS
jgi:CheY-like chemotaxis protein